MNRLAQRLSQIAIQVARRKRFSYTAYLEDWGLQDFLEEADANNYEFTEFVTRAIWSLCVEDGKFNNFLIGFETVLQFLNEERGEARLDQAQRFRDLIVIINTTGTMDAVGRWVESYYE